MGVNMVVFALKQSGGIIVNRIDYSLTSDRIKKWWTEADRVESRAPHDKLLSASDNDRFFTAENHRQSFW
jgi:hypothetical protein